HRLGHRARGGASVRQGPRPAASCRDHLPLRLRAAGDSMKLLVTGGAGFIGSAVVRRAIADGHEVVNLDALTYAASLSNVAEVADHPRYRFEKADIRDRAALDRIFAEHEPDAVMHLAAESHVDRSIDGPAAFIDTNVTGTYTLLEAARNWWDGSRDFRFHHVSTDE